MAESDLQVHDELLESYLRDIGEKLRASVKPGIGFCLVLSPFKQGKGTFFVSNLTKESTIIMLNELIARLIKPNA